MASLPLQEKKPGIWHLFLIWSNIGLQSFGGGASTIYLIQQSFIDKHKYITIEEYTHYMTLCYFTPGINLIALAVLIGRKLGGIKGIIASVVGMLLPSAIITCILAVGFKTIERIPEVQAIVRGVIPATAGIMAIVGIRFMLPLLTLARKEGYFNLFASIVVILAGATALILFKVQIAFVLFGFALAGIILFTPWRQRSSDSNQEKEERHD